ncbi:MAG: hypothetical protein ACRD21_05445, partial [Vicinamibacteria bacterium]
RVLFDVARSRENLLYGVAWPSTAFTAADAELDARLLRGAAETDLRSDLVRVNLVPVSGAALAFMSVGAPLPAVVFGLGEN